MITFICSKFLPAIEEYHDNPQELGAIFTKYVSLLKHHSLCDILGTVWIHRVTLLQYCKIQWTIK